MIDKLLAQYRKSVQIPISGDGKSSDGPGKYGLEVYASLTPAGLRLLRVPIPVIYLIIEVWTGGGTPAYQGYIGR
jgi:hypothetical protein